MPTIALQGEADGVHPPEGSTKHDKYFTGPYERRLLPGIGHNPPQEAPKAPQQVSFTGQAFVNTVGDGPVKIGV